MKTIFKNIATSLALIIILFAGCKNPAEDVRIAINTDIFKSPMLFQFFNANVDGLDPQSFKVEVTGPGASLVRTATGSKNFIAAAGLLSLFLDRTANPSPTNPIKFTIIVNASGYAPTHQDVEVTSATDPIIQRVYMSQYSNPSANTGAVVTTRGTTNGVIPSDVSFSTATNANMSLKANIKIAAGTGLLDASGVSIGGDQVEARVVYYSAAGVSAMPGGSFASNVIGANGQPIVGGVSFNSVGTVSIDMLYGSKEVKNFTKPVIVDMEVNPAMINPNTKQPIKENESIPMWSMDNKTGQWKSEGNTTFVKNDAGVLVARMPITHLSSHGAAFVSTNCSVPLIVKIKKPANSQNFEGFKMEYNSKTITHLVGGSMTDLTLTLRYGAEVPGDLIITALNNNYVTKSFTTSFANYCGSTASYTFIPKDDIINVEVDARFRCTDKDLLTGINSLVTVTMEGQSPRDAEVYNLVNGIGSGVAINGVTYNIKAVVDGAVYTGQYKAEKMSGSLSVGDFKGTTTYDAATNTLKVKGTVERKCN